ncbi:MAG: hypothetical protein LBP42_01225 [Treponema sp.]|jgi:chromosome segregation ATPase|nr:hypothetical protein [Treponema sp.]
METMENTPAPADAGIVFDTASGISEEEQREILAGIEELTGKGRPLPAPEPLKAAAKKRGLLFPLLVNGLALLLLGGGFFALFVFHGQNDVELRENSAELGVTERQLIEEIRKETADQLKEKEREISAMAAKLAGIDTEKQNLQAALETKLEEKERELRRIMEDEFEAERQRLTARNLSEAAIAEEMRKFDEQRILRLNGDLAAYRQQLDAEKTASENNFRQLQEEYRNSLTALQNERSQILEASRAREAALYAQAEKRIGELSSLYEQSSAGLNSAREELSRLTREQEQSGLIERQLNGLYIEVNRQIREGLLTEAAGTLGAMQDFLNTPSFQYIRSLQSRKETHLAAIAILSEMLAALQNREEPPAPVSAAMPAAMPADNSAEITAYENTIAELRAENTRLEQTVSDQRKTISAYSSEGTSLSRQLNEFENTIAGLRDQNKTLEQDLRSRNNETADLKSQVVNLQNQALLREQNLQSRETEMTALKAQAAAQEQRLQNELSALRSQAAAQEQRLQSENAALKSQTEAQARTLAEREAAIAQLNAEKAKAEEDYKNLQNRVEAARGLFE